jgi:hypothetical protein
MITPESLRVFLAYAKDADNWSGMPLIGYGGNVALSREAARAERGNLTQLKQAGLITTETDQGPCGPCVWMRFTPAGIKLAAEHGVDLSYHY